MAQVPDRILSWLWSILQTYSNPQAAYNDAVGALTAFPSLQPSTSVYTFDNGQSALLLRLSGTLPVDFRGTQYRFPLEIWLPQDYSQRGVSVICYIRPDLEKSRGPGADIAIRPGQHVSVDGRVYHPYLRDWNTRERSSVVNFLRICQTVFAKEPPVVSRQQQMQRDGTSRSPRPAHGHSAPAPPPKERPGSIQAAASPTSPVAPPLPLKPGQSPRANRAPDRNSDSWRRDGPPLPPLPHQQAPHDDHDQRYSRHDGAANVPHQATNGRAYPQSRSHGAPPPLPPLPAQVQLPYQQNGERSPVSPLTPEHRSEPANNRYQQPPPPPRQSSMTSQSQAYRSYPQDANGIAQPNHTQAQQPPSVQTPGPQPSYYDPSQGHQAAHYLPQQHQAGPQQYSLAQQQYPHPQSQHYYPQQAQPAQQRAAPPPDLLSDPFDISLPATTTGPPPPIPPNPEREHLLSLLSQSLHSQLVSKITQNNSALAPLQAQYSALQQSHAQLSSELQQLQSLDAALSSNEAILHRSLHDCDNLISSSASMQAPEIDDVLVAPTVASNQLWNLCADEVAIREAIWCLQRAVGAGRVDGKEFVRLTRGLAREGFLKMVLARKVAGGLGLDLGGKEMVGASS